MTDIAILATCASNDTGIPEYQQYLSSFIGDTERRMVFTIRLLCSLSLCIYFISKMLPDTSSAASLLQQSALGRILPIHLLSASCDRASSRWARSTPRQTWSMGCPCCIFAYYRESSKGLLDLPCLSRRLENAHNALGSWTLDTRVSTDMASKCQKAFQSR
jgi:hypothetical protein